MILVHETSFNILIHFLSDKRFKNKGKMIPYKNIKTLNFYKYSITYYYSR